MQLIPLRKHTGSVIPGDFRQEFYQAREAAGIVEWPDNALRYSFASYHLAHFKNAAATALDLGHQRQPRDLCPLTGACETERL